jgi:LacI family transcriptional regulator
MHPARRVTSKDVAERAGVSRTTVSLVLNRVPNTNISLETRERVFSAAEDLGYVPNAAAQALVNRNSGTIGLVLTRRNHTLATDAFFFQLVEGLLEVLRPHGLRLLVDMIEDESNHSYLRLARSHQVDGILLSGPRYDDAALAALAQRKFPLVLNGTVAGGQFNTVDVDNIASARLAVNHLIQLGHRRIACITNAPLSFTAASDRLSGYRQALEAVGLLFDERLVGQGAFDPQSGYEQMNRLLDQPERPTAVFVASDVVAFGALAALVNRGFRVPQDMALVGFDDVPMAAYCIPQLTTVHLPTHRIAQAAGERLVELLQGRDETPRQVLLETNLVVRQSCGANRSLEKLSS